MLALKLMNTQLMLTNKLDTCWETMVGVLLLVLVTIIPNSLTTKQQRVPVHLLSVPGIHSMMCHRIILMS